MYQNERVGIWSDYTNPEPTINNPVIQNQYNEAEEYDPNNGFAQGRE